MTGPDRWLLLEVLLPEPGGAAGDVGEARRAVARELLALGGGAVEESGRTLRTHLPAPDRPAELLERARRRLAESGAGKPRLRWRWVEDRDWARAWREGLGPRQVGRRLVVAPSWSDPGAGPTDVVLSVDPGMAFGTGEHGSTRGALRLLERALEPGDRVLDAGTGSGILAVAAARLGAARVVAVEKDADALETARENVRRNDVHGVVQLLGMELDADVARLLAPPAFDVTAANILAPVLRPLLGPFRVAAADGGRLILAGVLEEEAEAMVEAARAAGWRPEGEDRDDGWWAGLFATPAAG